MTTSSTESNSKYEKVYTPFCFNCASLQRQINHRLTVCEELHNDDKKSIDELKREIDQLKLSHYDEVRSLKLHHEREIKKLRDEYARQCMKFKEKVRQPINPYTDEKRENKKIGFGKDTITVKDIKKFKNKSKHNTY